MRILIAALIGGIVMFIWGAIAHMALGLGNPGIHPPAHEDAVLSSLHEGLGNEPGVYILPWLGPDAMHDQAAVKAYGAKASTAPYAWVVYLPQGEDMTRMGRPLVMQWVSDTLAALVLAALMSLPGLGLGRRLALAGAAAIFAWLSTMVPYWNWYRFPASFTVAALAEQVIGWLLAGAAMAWWIGRLERRSAL
ncbi:hypothetical protein [Frateuria terrea]|uniref:Uncharacterized protein n=1 Tax=Frateuria terrea TaxID=529704 RepID=A0A1H6URS0_9GAMM|nr:hypothetical protein [Frateuria terrea]SEI95113.1 hypothetical protein SAMN04487997_2145 [Frateuria terrea]SFP33565.1 hypothetical protein SAMN02927913_1582 [Frateuria terrea]